MTALIDADVIVYRAISVAASSVDWDGGGDMPLNNLPAAKKVADLLVRDWTLMAKEKQALLIFSDRTKPKASFRHHVHPFYKANRGGPKPPMHDEIHDYLYENYKSTHLRDCEGDDLMGILVTNDPKYVMVTIDKDMQTLPGRLVNPMDKNPTPKKTSAFEAEYNWMYQTIVGDQVDNFKGAPGAGPVAAMAALAGKIHADELYAAAMGVFSDQSHKTAPSKKFVKRDKDGMADWYQEFLMNARCARILRTGDYKRFEGEAMVRLWSPEESEIEWIDPHYSIEEAVSE